MQTSQKVRLAELISQDKQAEKITDMENEHYITLSSYGKGAHERIIKDGKYPVPFLGYRVSAGQFIYSRIDARNGAYDIVGPELDGFVVSKDFPIYDIDIQRVIPRFLLWSVLGNGFIQQVKQSSFGATNRMRIKEEILESYTINLPNFAQQEEIVNTLDSLQHIINKRRRELELYDDLIKARFVELFGHQSHNEKGFPYMTIDDVAEIYLGITHTPEYVDEGVTFISAKNTSGDFLDLTDVKYISRDEFKSAPNGSKPQKNDVLFSRVGSNLGHPVILEDDIELCTFVSLGFLRTKGKVTSNYLKHWMRDDYFPLQVAEHVKGGGQPNLNTGWLKQFKIIVPDLDAQYKFDTFCKQVDKSKVAVQKSLDETQKLFDSLMQEYFG